MMGPASSESPTAESASPQLGECDPYAEQNATCEDDAGDLAQLLAPVGRWLEDVGPGMPPSTAVCVKRGTALSSVSYSYFDDTMFCNTTLIKPLDKISTIDWRAVPLPSKTAFQPSSQLPSAMTMNVVPLRHCANTDCRRDLHDETANERRRKYCNLCGNYEGKSE
jgi:hypothetical protein